MNLSKMIQKNVLNAKISFLKLLLKKEVHFSLSRTNDKNLRKISKIQTSLNQTKRKMIAIFLEEKREELFVIHSARSKKELTFDEFLKNKSEELFVHHFK